jgi:hypothetical protein
MIPSRQKLSGMRMRLTSKAPRWTAIAVLLFAAAAPAALGAQKHATGLVLMRPDELAKIPPAFTPFSGDELPARVDLSADFPPPGNQGAQSSCVAWATAYALRSYQAHVRSRASLVTGDGHIDSARVFSPAFVYNQINNGRDAGSLFSDALQLMQTRGVAPLQYMPYSQTDYTSMPSETALSVAANYRIAFWKQVNVNELTELKSQLNAGYPVIIGAMIDEGFDNAGKGFVWDHIAGKQLGGHAMLVVGYDDSRNAFRVLNSWGTGWGDAGYYWLDYGLFPRVVNEAFVAKDALEPVVPTPTPTPNPTPTPPPPSPQPLPVVVTPPSAVVFESASVNVVRIRENVVDAQSGPGIRFDGTVFVPPGAQGNLQIVIQLYYDAGSGKKGKFVESASPRFAVGRVRSATGTKPFPLPAQGMRKAWYAFLPYSALKLQSGGNVALVAEPVLYVDKFGVKAGAKRQLRCACGS